MVCIRVHPDRLREAARLLARQSASVAAIGEELQRSINRLNTWAWDGNRRAHAEAILSGVGPQSRHLAEQLEDLSRKLAHAADEFERVDTLIADPRTSAFEQLKAYVDWIGDWQSAVHTVQTLAAAPVIAALIRTGSTYRGQVKVYGPHWMKDWAGLSAHLTHIKATNLPKHMAKQALKVSAIEVLLEAGSELEENWKEYKGDPIKTGIGVAVDTAIGVAIGAAAEAGGAYVGAAIGQVLIPIPGAGAIIGGAVGRIAARWTVERFQIDEKIENIRIGDRELDQWAVEQASGLVRNVEAQLKPFTRAVSSGFR